MEEIHTFMVQAFPIQEQGMISRLFFCFSREHWEGTFC